jgi:hypothetical protein
MGAHYFGLRAAHFCFAVLEVIFSRAQHFAILQFSAGLAPSAGLVFGLC